jgi:broad specificity phosphatase PhoE
MYLYVIRHAQPDYNAPVPYHTAPGPGLTPAGVAQAGAMAALLRHAGIERVLSSPLRRCVETATPLARELGLTLLIDDDLRESPPGEPPIEVRARMLRAALAQSDTRVAALVGHAAPLTELLRALTHDEIALPPRDRRGNHLAECMVWALHNRAGRWRATHVPAEGISL